MELSDKLQKLLTAVEELSVLELHQLVKAFEEKFGVSAAAVAVVSGGGAAASDAEEKTEFDVHLTSDGGAKIAVMKVVKEALGLGLKEAKDLVDGIPSVLKTGMKKEDADNLIKQIAEAGGKAEAK